MFFLITLLLGVHATIKRSTIVKFENMSMQRYQGKIGEVQWPGDDGKWYVRLLNGDDQGQVILAPEGKLKKVEYTASVDRMRTQTMRKGWNVGERVRIQNVSTASFNGKNGYVRSDVENGRQKVLVDDVRELKAFKVENLIWYPPIGAATSSSSSSSTSHPRASRSSFGNSPFGSVLQDPLGSMGNWNVFENMSSGDPFGRVSNRGTPWSTFDSMGMGYPFAGMGSGDVSGNMNRFEQANRSFDEILQEFSRWQSNLSQSQTASQSNTFQHSTDPAPNANIFLANCQNEKSLSTLTSWSEQPLPMEVFVLPITDADMPDNKFWVFDEEEVDGFVRNRIVVNPYNRGPMPINKEQWWRRHLQPNSSSPADRTQEEEEVETLRQEEEDSLRRLEEEENQRQQQEIQGIIDALTEIPPEEDLEALIASVESEKSILLQEKEEIETKIGEKNEEHQSLQNMQQKRAELNEKLHSSLKCFEAA